MIIKQLAFNNLSELQAKFNETNGQDFNNLYNIASLFNLNNVSIYNTFNIQQGSWDKGHYNASEALDSAQILVDKALTSTLTFDELFDLKNHYACMLLVAAANVIFALSNKISPTNAKIEAFMYLKNIL